MQVYTVCATRKERVSLRVEAASPEEAKTVLQNHGLWDEGRVFRVSTWAGDWIDEEDEVVLNEAGKEVG
ncbi:hypothetical protein JW921_05910 [Candidatus Fermentibacterales bacterium]|nr:hypothetical protein [Candidatus Fermentibacterales bacterium]